MEKAIQEWYHCHEHQIIELSNELWDRPELGFSTYFAADRTAQFLRENGFEDVRVCSARSIEDDLNTVIAKWGAGKPVIGIIGEYDALSEMGQHCVPVPAPIPGPGHACGHNLMGAGCAGAAAALRYALDKKKLSGTVIYYGCPAEEGGAGKAHMLHNGLFADANICLAWHPMSGQPCVNEDAGSATISFSVDFYGKSTHAGFSPWLGRSALDASEIMNVAVQYLREHVPDGSRIHYTYDKISGACNIVPEHVRLSYMVRAADARQAIELYRRVALCAHGAAVATETQSELTITSETWAVLINHTLNRVLYDATQKIPALKYTQEDIQFANALSLSATGHAQDNELPVSLKPLENIVTQSGVSSDLGNLSHCIPTTELSGFCWPYSLSAHHWSTTAVGRHAIAHKGMIFCGKAIAQAGYDLCVESMHVQTIHKEFAQAKQSKPVYSSWLDYEKKTKGDVEI